MQWWAGKRLVFFLLLCFSVSVSVTVSAETEDKKRLLLTDPDVLSSRLGRLESSLQDILTKYTTQETAMQNLQTKYSTQETAYQNLQITMQNLQIKYTSQETAMQSLQTKNSALETELQSLRARLSQQETTTTTLTSSLAQASRIENNQGSMYVRWGRTNCDANNTELVYSGYAAGEKYYHGSSYHGGASNMLCLPDSPELSTKSAGGASYLYSAEYDDSTIQSGALEQDIPCAVCRSKNTTSSVMIPARKTCFPGWKREYHGIIVSDAYSDSASEFICLDSNPEYVPAGHANTNGRRLFTTGINCESIVCPPYEDGKQVLCAVCSK